MGLSAEEFWNSTPRELALAALACKDRERRAQQQRVEMAWLMAKLARAKTIPSLKRLLPTPRQTSQTWQDMKAALKGFTDGH